MDADVVTNMRAVRDGALAVAGELLGQTRPGSAIEVRPILEGRFGGA